MLVTESVGVAVRSLFPTIRSEDKYYMLYAVHVLYLLHPFFATILAIWWVLDLLSFHYLVVLSYSGKVTKALPVTPSGCEMAFRTVVWGVL